MDITNLNDGIRDWLLHIATGPLHARSAIVTINRVLLMRDVLDPIREALGDAVTVSTTGSCKMFDRRIHIVTREEHLRGMALHGLLVHEWPDRCTHQYAEHAIARDGGQMFYALRG